MYMYTYASLISLLYITPHRPIPSLHITCNLHTPTPWLVLGRDADEGGMLLRIPGDGLQEAAEEGCAVL